MKNKILALLSESDSYVSGERISELMGVSRASVWKHIKRLRQEGYEIASVTNKGYKLISCPDTITSERIYNGLRTKAFAQNTLAYPSVTSTNVAAKENSSFPDGTLFVADIQTAGRGRLGRSWSSPPGCGIWMSFLLKPDMQLADVPKITLAAGLGVCKAINDMFDVGAKIKWPNDITIGSKKVCGILTELSADIDGVNYAVCGIGINVNNEEFPADISSRATSLLIETGRRHDRCEIIRRVSEEFEKYYNALLDEGFSKIRDEYKAMCVNIGRDVIITQKNEQITARCTDISEGGNLVAENENGTFEVNSGEVSVRGIYDYV